MPGPYRRSYSCLAGSAVLALYLFVPAPLQAQAQKVECRDISARSVGSNDLQVIKAEWVVGDEKAKNPHCLIRGAIESRTGVDGKAYAIGFEVRLPEAWNGRYFHQANGGADGEIVPAYGSLLGGDQSKNALSLGYAVLSSDAGHDGKAFPEFGIAGGSAFGLDPLARVNYGHAATPKLFDIAQRIFKAYYGRAQEFSYMAGCSNGGRHGLVAATRYPELFHGILAGAPGFDLPRAALKGPADSQAMSRNGLDLRTAFSPDEMKLVGREIVKACDRLDGAVDEMVGDLAACQKTFDLRALTCSGDKSDACLRPAQVSALQAMMNGPRTSKGEQLYPAFPYDPGIGAPNWRFWRLESNVPPWERYPLTTTLGAASLAYIFTTPPTRVEGRPAALLKFQTEFDLDRDAERIHAKEGPYSDSAMEFMAPPQTDDPKLTDFKNAKGKLILFHGQADGVFSIDATARWYEKLQANNANEAGAFSRFYPVPGMAHCSGGPATDSFALFEALVNWVEKGEAPVRPIAQAQGNNPDLPASWGKTRSRPLCQWPLVPRYDGSGDMESEASFQCKP